MSLSYNMPKFSWRLLQSDHPCLVLIILLTSPWRSFVRYILDPTQKLITMMIPFHCFINWIIHLQGLWEDNWLQGESSQKFSLIMFGCRWIFRVKCLTHSCLDLHIFTTFFNYKQFFKNENKFIVFIYLFLPIGTNRAV